MLKGDREVVEKRVNLNKLCTVKMQSVSVQNRKKLCHQNWHSKGQGEKMKKSDNFGEGKYGMANRKTRGKCQKTGALCQ